MSKAAIDSLDTAAQTLRRAMQDGDAEKMTQATTALAAALDTLRGIGAWRTDPALKERLRAVLTRLDSDQHLSRLLGDLVGQRLTLLAGITADATAPVTYGRKG